MGVADLLLKKKKELALNNLNKGLEFLEENKNKEGVTVLPSGLQYQILKTGEGEKPQPTSSVTCHYHGTTIEGVVFDSSLQRKTPATFRLDKVISGWTEALQMMPKGSKWMLFLPPNLAYGEQQISKEIGPNSTLIFEVELLDFS